MFSVEKSYRDQIRDGNQNVTFLFLDGSFDLIMSRMTARKGHFMKSNMVESQFNTLERPDNEDQVAVVDIDTDIDTIVKHSIVALNDLKEEKTTA